MLDCSALTALRRSLCSLVLAAAAAGAPVGVVLDSAAASPNLWVGVLQDDMLVPVGALVRGKWWHQDKFDDDQRQVLYQSLGKHPAQWLPMRAPLPRVWQARFFKSPTVARTLHIVGGLRPHRRADEQYGVGVDLSLPAATPTDAVFSRKGVAWVGDVSVRFFEPVPQAQHAALVAAADTEIQRAAPGSARMVVERALSSARSDGTTFYFIEGASRFEPKDGRAACDFHPNATLLKDASGRLRVVDVSAVAACDGSVVSFEPLAVLDRGGSSCWLTAVLPGNVVDGVEYELAMPGHTGRFDCTLK